ncbi:CBO0543 family protein [Niallia sp. NCCP-28]|uniref:CBO0543 family protein n=1 Tax=Niallia sp. NCCP-28 TaxID=2934712 RepID=UPI002080BBD5|nr:CBO0543 family protein [Niallia sp. NCCP-28]GKU82593.1 hypothetical protein NCCP28_19890 [Niallia sp. NCCP-28]
MSIERWILIGILVLSILVIYILVPKDKAKDAWVLFLSLQVITWPAGLLAVEIGLIEYPIQLLPVANEFNKSSFSFEFFLFPVTAIIFSLYFPKKFNKMGKFLYYLIFAGFFTCLEVILERHTGLVEYHGWKGYWTLITVIASLFINHSYYIWFRKGIKT